MYVLVVTPSLTEEDRSSPMLFTNHLNSHPVGQGVFGQEPNRIMCDLTRILFPPQLQLHALESWANKIIGQSKG